MRSFTQSEAEIKLIVNEEEIIRKVSNFQTSETFIDRNGVLRATVNEVGSLVTGDAPPNQNNYVATFGNAHNIYGRKRGRAVHLHVVLKV